MTVAAVAGICVILLIIAFLAPRLSRKPQRGVDRAFGAGGRAAGKVPGKLGTWLRKPFGFSQRAADRSAAAGRKGRRRMPI